MADDVAASNTDIPIYIGFWTNWSRGIINGSTLTLSRRDGAFLTAFLAIFITYCSSILWRLLCLTLGLSLSSDNPNDAIYHQRQAVFRNASSAPTALWIFVKMVWAWTRKKDPKLHPKKRIVPLIVLCTFFWALFAAAGIFSSNIVIGDEVLISSPNCGRPGRDIVELRGVYGAKPSYRLIGDVHLQRVISSKQYASSCYDKEQGDIFGLAGSNCNVFIKPKLPITVTRNANCPFNPGLCTVEHDNIFLDARINTRDDLGLNLRESLDLRWTTHCGHLKSEGRTEVFNYSQEQSYVKYNFGRRLSPFLPQRTNYTRMVRKRDFEQYRTLISDSVNTETNRFVKWHAYIPLNGAFSEIDSTLDPIDELAGQDADLHLILLTSNFAQSVKPVNDPWYSAHREFSIQINSTNPALLEQTTSYFTDDEVSTLACRSQFQACPQGSSNGCTTNEGILDTYFNSVLDYDGKPRSELLLRTFQALAVHHPLAIVNWHGTNVIGSDGQYVVGYLPDDQWQLDVILWHQVFLAAVQGSFVDIAAGPPVLSPPVAHEWLVANTTEERQFCLSQKVRSLAHVNFSVLWLSIILILGVLAVIADWSIEPAIVWLDQRRKRQRYSLLEWYLNDTLQMQRLAHESSGYGSWANCADGIPVTSNGAVLGTVDSSDIEHLRLKRRVSNPSITPPQRVSADTEERNLMSEQST